MESDLQRVSEVEAATGRRRLHSVGFFSGDEEQNGVSSITV